MDLMEVEEVVIFGQLSKIKKLVETIVELKISRNFDGKNASGLRKGCQNELEKIKTKVPRTYSQGKVTY